MFIKDKDKDKLVDLDDLLEQGIDDIISTPKPSGAVED
jgi:ABC-type sulfate transport system substrate-binding protein|tara:strand:+ start:1664 stop:1777 length:114 start_codon:yes stop_codon:yes gene_type:complete